MKKILFTCVGHSDPVLNEYDGPILHILRNYSDISKVYLYFSSEMWSMHIKDDRYQYAFNDFKKRENKDFEVIYINSEIIEAADYDNFQDDFIRIIKEILFENPDYELLLNISSGTPAMKTTMMIIGVDLISTTSKVKIIQVSHPNKRGNSGEKGSFELADIIGQCKNNVDYLENSKRTSEPKLFHLHQSKIQKQIKSFLESYNYAAASKVYEDSLYINDITMSLMKHLEKRVKLELDSKENVTKIQDGFGINLYYNEDFKLINYYLILKINQKLNRITDLVIRLNPFVINLQLKFLEKFYNFKLPLLENKRYYYGRKERRVSSYEIDDAKFFTQNRECYEYCVNKGNRYQNLKGVEPSIFILNYMIEYFSNKYSDENIVDFMEAFKKLEKINQIYRNKAAHSLENVTDNDLMTEPDIKVQSNWIISKTGELMKYLYPNEKLDLVYNFYDNLNKIILNNL